jgi:hypothetical protein
MQYEFDLFYTTQYELDLPAAPHSSAAQIEAEPIPPSGEPAHAGPAPA